MLKFPAVQLPPCPPMERRTVRITEGKIEKFRADNVLAPKTWSDTAVSTAMRIWARKLPGATGVQHRFDDRTGQLVAHEGYEDSIPGMFARVVNAIREGGVKHGYFDASEGESFAVDLLRVCLGQYALFNTPVWINVGATDRPQSSACFILDVQDSLDSLRRWQSTETHLFSAGSGAGADLSALRPENWPLSGGGTASGPVSFARGTDAWAGVTKSGGKCLAPYQKVYTEDGPVAVSDLAKRASFVVLSYDPPARRYKAKRGFAWLSGEKQVLRVKTDKGAFDLSYDHPIRLSTGHYVKAGELKVGMSLFSCAIDETETGYVRVHLRDGKKNKELFHRMIIRDVLSRDIDNLVVHHVDENKKNNSLANLEVMTKSEHTKHHADEAVANGTCHFQHVLYPKGGKNNPMHHTSEWWDTQEAQEYRKKQGRILQASGRAVAMQDAAAEQKMLNTLFQLLCAGYDVSTEEAFIEARRKHFGRICSVPKLKEQIKARFGSYANYREEARKNNHQVVGVEVVGVMPVYDIEVECPTEDDHSPASGHNFVIWSGDSHFGSGIVVSNSRRAAKMLTLSVEHPDVEKFIVAKRDAQRRAHALIDAGYSGAWQSDTWQLEPFQNANLSVRVTDEFMRAVEQDATWEHSFDGKPAGQVKARSLWNLICESAHESGDPGIQFDTTINKWHTVPYAGRIRSSNPCSEYLHLQNSACNLASLNLLKFIKADGVFDVPLFQHVVRLLIVAMDIIVEISSYPTPEITNNSKNFRPLGLGHCNGGALLMRSGIPYDSNEGRDRLAAITSLMAGTAYAVSAELARQLGPFAGYEANRDAMLDVIRRHLKAANTLAPMNPDDARTFDVLAVEGCTAWAEALQRGKAHGFRNSQATLLAPTGTIGIVMDCDTTGIEPEYDLITYKSLASGGVTRKVSGSVSHALRALGHEEATIDRIVTELERDGRISRLPVQTGRSNRETEVLKTAAGQWPLSAEAHIRMCAAVQPFLSGGISKTVNLPNSATVEDVSAAYMLAWKLGVKCVALYRDGCKRSQPLNSASGNGNGSGSKPATFAVGGTTSTNSSTVILTVPIAVEPSLSSSPAIPVNSRRRPPKVRQGRTEKLSLAGHDVYLTVNYYPDGKTPCELFVRMAKWGSTEGALMDALCQSVSIGLQHGVPLASFIEKWSGTQFAPAGFTGQEDIRSASSVLDLFAKVLARLDLGENELSETTEAPAAPASPAEQSYRPENLSPCCGATYRNTGSCKTCTNCGSTSGGCG